MRERGTMSKNKEKEEHAEVHESETAENYEYAVKIMRRLLQSVGIWPFTSATYPRFLRLFLIAAMCFLLTFFMVPIALHTFMIVNDFKTRARIFGPFVFGMINMIKFVTLILRENDFRECLDWLSHDWRMTRRRIENDLMLASARTGVTFTTMCASFMWVSGMSYSTLFSFMQQRTVVNNISLKAFAYPGYYVFFDPYDHFYKIYTIQSMCGLAAFTTTAAVASIAIAFTMHVCGQIAVISHALHSLASGSFDKDTFCYIIEKHLRALRLANKLEDLLNGICLVELMSSCFHICILGYYIVMEFDGHNPGPYTYFMLIVSFTFNIFTFCYIGEQLSEKCNNIGNMVYHVNWYDLSPNDTRSLIMIILSTHRPVVLTAGKITILCMRSFSNVLKAALSYLNMLRTVTTS